MGMLLEIGIHVNAPQNFHSRGDACSSPLSPASPQRLLQQLLVRYQARLGEARGPELSCRSFDAHRLCCCCQRPCEVMAEVGCPTLPTLLGGVD